LRECAGACAFALPTGVTISAQRSKPTALSGTARTVRRLDYDRYLTLVFAPADVRDDLATLYAFNIEIAKTRETVTEPLLGQIRLQWWRESIESAYTGTPRRHEIVQPLADAIRRHDLTRAHFDALIDAREFDLTADPPATLEQLENYAYDTSSRLMLLGLETCRVRGPLAETAARHFGIAWALIGLMRAARFHAAQKRQYVPASIMRETGADADALFDLKSPPEFRAAVQQVCQRARTHLDLGRQAARGLGSPIPAPLRLGSLAGLYLRRIERAGYDVLARPVPAGPLRKQWALLLGRRG